MANPPRERLPLTPEEVLARLRGDQPQSEFGVPPQQPLPEPSPDTAPPRRKVLENPQPGPAPYEPESREPPTMIHNGNPVYTHDGPTTAPADWYREGPGMANANRMERGVRATTSPFGSTRRVAGTHVPASIDEPLYTTQEEYEQLLPPQVRDSMNRRRQAGNEVPFDPVPDHVLHFWRQRGPNLTQAEIQWGYAQRDSGSTGSSGGGNPTWDQIPDMFPGEYAPGHRPGPDSLEDLAQRDDDIGRRARDLIEEREQRLNPPPERVPGAGGGKTGAELVEAEGLGDRPDLARLYDERPWLAGGHVDDEQAAANNLAYREYGLRDSTFHPQQEFNLGTAQQQTAWNNFVGSSVDRMNRYRPGVLKPEIDAPGWREVHKRRTEESNAILSDPNATPEEKQAAQAMLDSLPERESKMRAIELRQRERAIIKRYGDAISDETAAELAAAVDAGDSERVREIHDMARRNNLLSRQRNFADLQQNQRMVALLNDPNTREGFIYRTMAQGTPQERSALAAALGDDMVYPLEMASMMPGEVTTEDTDPEDETTAAISRKQYVEIRNMLLEGNYDMAYQAALQQAQAMYPNADPATHSAQAQEQMDSMMIRMTYGDQEPRVDWSNHPALMRRMQVEAGNGIDSFMEFAARHGLSEQQAKAMYRRATGKDPDASPWGWMWPFDNGEDSSGGEATELPGGVTYP